MHIAIVGGGASGMVTAYLLHKQGHQVTVFEQQPRLGGHICTLNQNIQPNQRACDRVLEAGVLEFPDAFQQFGRLMQELDVPLEPVHLGSGLFFQKGRHFLSPIMIDKNRHGWQRWLEFLHLEGLYARSAGFWAKIQFSGRQDWSGQRLGDCLPSPSARDLWLKLLIMYSYSTAFDRLGEFPAELAISTLRDYVFVNWFRIPGGVYIYIQKILDRFTGKIFLDVKKLAIARHPDRVEISLPDDTLYSVDKIVFATPPDQILKLLTDPTDAEIKRFSAWKANYATTLIHTDTALYHPFRITAPCEFDFFQTDRSWGYNACLNQLCGVPTPPVYSLAFQLDQQIAPDRIIHRQFHHTPLYTVDAFRHRAEIIATNGENHTYYAGAYLGDGLHEGAITSAIAVADRIG